MSFIKKEDAEKAMREMKGQQLRGRNIRTNWAARKATVPVTKQLSLDEISRQASPYNSTVYVGNLPPGCTDDTLRQNFSHFGQIYDIKIFPEKFYGFIKFYTHEQALDAIYKSQRTVLGDNLLKCSWGKEQTDMNNAQSAMQQWQQYYQQYYQQVYNQQPMQQQSPAQGGYVQYPAAAAAAAQYVYYPQQAYGTQPMQVVQTAMPGYPAQMSPASSAGQQPPNQNQQMMGMIGPHHQGAPSPANPTSYVMQQAAGYPTQ